MSAKVVVFGGAGFLGSHVADVLLEKGFDVFIFDSRESRYLNKKQKMIVGDICDFDEVLSVVKGAQIVYNFAGIADIKQAGDDPINVVKTNVLGNTHILEACRLNKVERFIFASSLYVYGGLGSFYRASKQSCELLVEEYQKKFGLNYTVLRYGSLYGERANEFNFIHHIIKQALTDGKIVRHGDGEEVREYINVIDAARCSVEILEKNYCNECVMITGSQTMKIKDLLLMIQEMMENKVKIEYVEARNEEHYEMTPYLFKPKVAKRYVSDNYCDLGEGILSLIYKVHQQISTKD